MTPETEVKDPCVLEFLGLENEYSESAMEEDLIAKLETFLPEVSGDFTFVGRQRWLRLGDEWYRAAHTAAARRPANRSSWRRHPAGWRPGWPRRCGR